MGSRGILNQIYRAEEFKDTNEKVVKQSISSSILAVPPFLLRSQRGQNSENTDYAQAHAQAHAHASVLASQSRLGYTVTVIVCVLCERRKRFGLLRGNENVGIER